MKRLNQPLSNIFTWWCRSNSRFRWFWSGWWSSRSVIYLKYRNFLKTQHHVWTQIVTSEPRSMSSYTEKIKIALSPLNLQELKKHSNMTHDTEVNHHGFNKAESKCLSFSNINISKQISSTVQVLHYKRDCLNGRQKRQKN